MTNAPLHRLLYISTARRELSAIECEMILRTSRRNNSAVSVTGLLVTGGRRFLQALEGPVDAVMTTYTRIKADPRHFAAVVLADEPIVQRSFAAWAMDHRNGDATAHGEASVAALIAPITDATLRGYFEGFLNTHARAA